MKIRTSYFYQIRNFKPYMIPISTALGDPKWFHDNKGNYFIYHDKRNILNGVRYHYIMAQGNCHGACPCTEKNPSNCQFLKDYRQELEKLNFDKIIKDLTWFAEEYQKTEGFQEEPIIVLMLHESIKNPCSERQVLQDYFNDHGVECKELTYPIK